MFDETVVWSRPTNTGREITRYELRFHTSGQLNTVPSRTVLDPNQQWFRPTHTQLPSGGPIYVQVSVEFTYRLIPGFKGVMGCNLRWLTIPHENDIVNYRVNSPLRPRTHV